MLSLEEVCKRIQPADAEVMHRVWKIWDNKCIPLRSLDWLQETLVRIAGVQRTTRPSIERKDVYKRQPLYCPLSNGKTRNFADVWGGDAAYLVSVDSGWDKSSSDYMEKIFLSRKKIIRSLAEADGTENALSLIHIFWARTARRNLMRCWIFITSIRWKS